ncbi:ELMO domain-containing protein A [Vitis vinifera]|uniref:ELMO domain-containing protein A n=1 Tax=Vitis vinifera TaxID=29760 RepID=A0A438EFD8_VITVI|nr:ELMO domain-containing protein A [Vitis vinifera]
MVDEDEVYWRQKKDDDELEWSHNSTHVISQLAQCFSNAMVGSRSWVIGFFNRYGNKRSGNDKYLDYPLSPLQEQRLQRLQDRLQVPFDETRTDHQEALRALWHAAFPNIVLRGLISEQWKDMGWQGPNPSTDFRGCGFVSLENLLFFARTYPASFHRLLFKQDGDRATWEYPFAVAGINVSFMLIQMLDLCSAKPKCLPGINFVKLLGGGPTSNKNTIGERAVFRRRTPDTRSTSLQPVVPVAWLSAHLHKSITLFNIVAVNEGLPNQHRGICRELDHEQERVSGSGL